MLWQQVSCRSSIICASSAAVTSAPSPNWLVSKFWQNTQRRLHQPKKIAIFFGWCNLRCVFCQNFETSQFGEGAEVTAAELAQMMLDLQDTCCHNINFVTPEQVVTQTQRSSE